MSTPAFHAIGVSVAETSPDAPPITGYANSSQNARKFGLFATRDFIRPDEELYYAALDQGLREELVPAGILETNLVDEIRRAMWRLRRCSQVEEKLIDDCTDVNQSLIRDPMWNDTTAKIQASVDRARSQSHRLLHKSTAELRKLQTERQYRNESFEAGTDISHFGLCNLHAVRQAVRRDTPNARNEENPDDFSDLDLRMAESRLRMEEMLKRQEAARQEDDSVPATPEEPASPVQSTESGPTRKTSAAKQTPRNAKCPCNSGKKYKKCCGFETFVVAQAA